jgi:ABC-type Mn2+/Zn2+ transport system ATPase subunit
MIHIENLHCSHRGKTLLAIDHFDVNRGEVLAILGPNGAGKSTLFKILCGLRHAQADALEIFDTPMQTLGRWAKDRLRVRIGYIPQELASRCEMPLTVREIVAIGQTGRKGLFRRLDRNDREKADYWLAFLKIAHLADRPYGELSGGEMRRVLLAKALVQEPDMLLLDEPASHMDLQAREQLVELLNELYRQTGLTILLVSHEVEIIPPCCRRIVLLHQGTLIADGPAEMVLTQKRVEDFYGANVTLLARKNRFMLIPRGLGN